MTLGILMPDPQGSMFVGDPITGSIYVSGGMIQTHKNYVDSDFYRLFCAQQQAKNLPSSQRSRGIDIVDQELRTILNEYEPGVRTRQYDRLYDLSKEFSMEIIERMLNFL